MTRSAAAGQTRTYRGPPLARRPPMGRVGGPVRPMGGAVFSPRDKILVSFSSGRENENENGEADDNNRIAFEHVTFAKRVTSHRHSTERLRVYRRNQRKMEGATKRRRGRTITETLTDSQRDTKTDLCT